MKHLRETFRDIVAKEMADPLARWVENEHFDGFYDVVAKE